MDAGNPVRHRHRRVRVGVSMSMSMAMVVVEVGILVVSTAAAKAWNIGIVIRSISSAHNEDLVIIVVIIVLRVSRTCQRRRRHGRRRARRGRSRYGSGNGDPTKTKAAAAAAALLLYFHGFTFHARRRIALVEFGFHGSGCCIFMFHFTFDGLVDVADVVLDLVELALLAALGRLLARVLGFLLDARAAARVARGRDAVLLHEALVSLGAGVGLVIGCLVSWWKGGGCMYRSECRSGDTYAAPLVTMLHSLATSVKSTY